MARYSFQTSMIWEAGDPVDPNGDFKIIKAKSEENARKRLPDAGLGRKWILTCEEISENEFDKRFTLMAIDEDDSQTTDDIKIIRNYPENRVWSLVDGDNGRMCMVNGFAVVNFVSWQVTEEPHNGDYSSIVVNL